MRVALHVGPVGKDAEGLTGPTVDFSAARIVDAPVIKARLAAEQADLVFAASDYVYDHVVRNCDGRVDPAAFEHMECQVKESHVSARVHLAGRVGLPRDPGPHARSPPGLPALRPGWCSGAGTAAVALPLGKLLLEVRGRDLGRSASCAWRSAAVGGGPAARS